jgi:hypothetical protein
VQGSPTNRPDFFVTDLGNFPLVGDIGSEEELKPKGELKMTTEKTQPRPPEYGVLADATKGRISMRGQALLQWGYVNGFARYSVEMPDAVVDQILAWRDEAQSKSK